MRQEATPRKRNFREMAALLELCGVRSGGRVTTIFNEMVNRSMRWVNITSCLAVTMPWLSALLPVDTTKQEGIFTQLKDTMSKPDLDGVLAAEEVVAGRGARHRHEVW